MSLVIKSFWRGDYWCNLYIACELAVAQQPKVVLCLSLDLLCSHSTPTYFEFVCQIRLLWSPVLNSHLLLLLLSRKKWLTPFHFLDWKYWGIGRRLAAALWFGILEYRQLRTLCCKHKLHIIQVHLLLVHGVPRSNIGINASNCTRWANVATQLDTFHLATAAATWQWEPSILD